MAGCRRLIWTHRRVAGDQHQGRESRCGESRQGMTTLSGLLRGKLLV
jgi:hypothetical protein